MAKQSVVTYMLTDDLDGSELGQVAEGANPFGRVLNWDGEVYDLDLSDENATKMEEALSQARNNVAAARETAARIIAEAEAIADELMKPFTIESARRKPVPVAAKQGKKSKASAGKPTLTPYQREMEGYRRGHIRHWAGEHIADFPQQGRIPGDVVAAFDAGKDVAALHKWAQENGRTIKARPVSVPPAVVPAQAAPAEAAPAAPAKSTRAKAKS
jgi:hypothetical protein